MVKRTPSRLARQRTGNGVITLMAGGHCCFLGDNGPVTTISLAFPEGIAVGSAAGGDNGPASPQPLAVEVSTDSAAQSASPLLHG